MSRRTTNRESGRNTRDTRHGKLYAAVQDTSIHLHLLDRKTRHRIHEKMVNPRTGKVVPNEEIERAFDEGARRNDTGGDGQVPYARACRKNLGGSPTKNL